MKVYISNRSEIASRVIRTAKQMGIKTCVGFSSVDKEMPFVREADQALEIECEEPRQAYLNHDQVIETAKKLEATHIHPGYGFLSESPIFLDKLDKTNLKFIGPPAESMRKLGDKMESRRFLKSLDIPLLPAYDDEEQSAEKLKEEAQRLGFPLLIKPSAGGGGKGMFRVDSLDEFIEKLESSKRIARSSFGDDRVYLERFIEKARHIEVQILADQFRNVKAIGERECSVQRRHQKLIEESPCLSLSESLRRALFDYSCRIAEAVNYESAGTIEWIWDGSEGLYFLEMNTRLQVEHPVTELVYGLDLVEWQFKIAQGEMIKDISVQPQGHAIEARLCAEDPSKDFIPTGGVIHRLRLPEDVRVDFGYTEKNEVSSYFDSMLGKIIAYGEDRELARTKLISALEKLVLMGPGTNRSFLIQILNSKEFSNLEIYTALLDTLKFKVPLSKALATIKKLRESGGGQAPASSLDLEEDLDWYSPWGHLRQPTSDYLIEDFGSKRYFYLPFYDWSQPKPKRKELAGAEGIEEEAEKKIKSPMPSKVIQILVKEGEEVKRGANLMVLEAMKMEHKIKAPSDSRVKKLYVVEGQQVPPDEMIVELE